MVNPYYPSELAEREHQLVQHRRKKNGLPAVTEESKSRGPYVGLALSGGGIRSATFCLGVCQHLARSGRLRFVDFLSTVSGGGFLGGFLGAWIHRTDFPTVEAGLPQNEDRAVRFLRENGRYIAPNGSGDIGVAVASYLRGWLAVLGTLGLFVFAFLVVGAAAQEWLLTRLPETWRPPALFWDAHTGGIWLSPWWVAPYVVLILWVLPLGAAFWLLGEKPLRLTPLIWAFMWVTASVLVYCLVRQPAHFPRMLWQDARGLIGILALMLAALLWTRSREAGRPRAWAPTLGALVCAGGSYLAFNGPHLALPWSRTMFSPAIILHQVLALSESQVPLDPFDADLLWIATIMLGYAWVVAFAGAALSNNVDFVRRKLTELTTLGLWAILGLAAFAAVDTLGGTCFSLLEGPRGANNVDLFRRLLQLSPVATVASAALQKILRVCSDATSKRPSFAVPTALLVTTAALVIAVGCLTFLSLCAHVIAARADAIMVREFVSGLLAPSHAGKALWGLAGLLLLLSCCVGHTKTLLNLSSDLQLYNARLTRAYLGATNPKRQNDPARANVTQPEVDDDVPFVEYHPEAKGGPLHLINVTVNETISGRSNLEQKDRHGFSMTAGPVGLTIGRFAHALVESGEPGRSERLATMLESSKGNFQKLAGAVRRAGEFVASRWERYRLVRPLAGPDFHPLALDAQHPEPRKIEMPTLGSWIAISGAAFSTGLGQRTGSGYSFLTGFFNVRLGYWWDSTISPFSRKGPQALGFREWLGYAAAAVFPAQGYLLDEFLARFHGPSARQLWNLTDGGHFENTGVYELIRRRVRFIVLCDCGEDHTYLFEDVANLVRKARIDFNAEITFLQRTELDQLMEKETAKLFGDLADFRSRPNDRCPHQAALARIVYLDGSAPPSHLLLLKPSLRGDEPADLLDYQAKQPQFPQQSTMDQFFDEAQWESYRRLGELIAERVFAPPPLTGAVGEWRPYDFFAP